MVFLNAHKWSLSRNIRAFNKNPLYIKYSYSLHGIMMNRVQIQLIV